jgi:hypothetical protein
MNLEPQSLSLAQFANLSPKELDGRVVLVEDESGHVPCKIKLRPRSGRLFVMFNGAVTNRSTVKLPVFARWNWGKVLDGHVLSVCDPTLYLDDELTLGWFLGTRQHDPMLMSLRIVDALQSKLGVEPENTIFYGSSGGGFAAMRAASMRKVGRAIAVNPQTAVTRYYTRHVDRIASLFDPGATAAQSSTRYPERWNAIHAIDEARRRGNDLRILYVQNLEDRNHHAKHFTPFCKHFGINAEGGEDSSRSLFAHLYSYPDGHGVEPPEVVKFITSEGLNHLAGAA